MKNKILLLFFIFSMSVFSEESFSIDLKPNGHFNINYKMTFSLNENINNVFYELFLDEQNQKLVNVDLISQKSSLDLKKSIFKVGSYNYSLATQLKRMGVTATIKNSCLLTVSDSSIVQSCLIISSNAGIFGKMFNSGSSTMECLKKEEIICKINIQGQTVGINAYFVSRTADRLAVSGSSKTVTDLHKSYLLITENSTKSSNIFSSNFSQLWEKMMKKLERNETLKSNFKVTSNNNGIVQIN